MPNTMPLSALSLQLENAFRDFYAKKQISDDARIDVFFGAVRDLANRLGFRVDLKIDNRPIGVDLMLLIECDVSNEPMVVF